MKTKIYLTLFLISLITFRTNGQHLNQLLGIKEINTAEKIRIREVTAISKEFGDEIWPGYSKLPYPFLLVNDSVEFLTNYPNPPTGFTYLGFDSIMNSEVYIRKRKFPKAILSAFPIASNGVPVLVAGTPENIKITSTEWVTKVLHERFHQLQQSYKEFVKESDALGLAGDDTTGRWMINYPFPYQDSSINWRYKKYSKALAHAVAQIGYPEFKSALATFKSERSSLLKMLKPLDYKYFSFQLWLEGIAMYTEYKFLTLLESYTPTYEFKKLPDYIEFSVYRKQVVSSQSRFLNELDLKIGKRVTFYTMGYGEGRILDAISQNWRKKYFKKLFFIEKYSAKLEKR
ncbi:MAG: hypothetical protein U0289_14205 [Cyclobacteriaceae bacterium]